MYRLYLASIFITVSFMHSNVFAEPLDKQDFLGDWKLVYVGEIDGWATVLRIEEHRFLLCGNSRCVDPVVGNVIEHFDDIIFLTLEVDAVPELKLILGGYKNEAKSALFGTRFHYQEGVVISGLPMVYNKMTSEDK